MTSDEIKKQITALYDDGVKVVNALNEDNIEVRFGYQKWYTKALKVVESLAPDRLSEFRSYYEPSPRRKSLDPMTYVIQDYFKGVSPAGWQDFDPDVQTKVGISNQLSILESLLGRVDFALTNIEITLLAELQDAELAVAHELLKVSPRAAGALSGVVLEGHLQKVSRSQGISTKRHPTIGDLNDPLKNAGVYDTATWRKVSYLGDIRNLCTHKKGVEPTVEQVRELIDGVNWAVKNVR